MSIQKLLAVFALVITTSGADAAPLRYQIVDYNNTLDPLDKGFSVSGTVEASGLGNFVKGENPFTSWNITEIVGSTGGPTQSYSFTQDNSTWDLDQTFSGDAPLAVMQIEENFIYLPKIYFPTANVERDNSVTLNNSGADQSLLWLNRGIPTIPNWYLFSTNNDASVVNGVYEGSGDNFLFAIRIPSVPLPASGLLLIGAVVALGAQRARRRSA